MTDKPRLKKAGRHWVCVSVSGEGWGPDPSFAYMSWRANKTARRLAFG